MQHGDVAPYNKIVYEGGVAQAEDYSGLVAANIRAARARLGITQAKVARRMRRLGFDWYQQTTGAVERGDRRIGAEELVALALSLRTRPTVLLEPPSDVVLVVFPSGERVPSQRISVDDESVTWEGDDDELRISLTTAARTEAAYLEEFLRERREPGDAELRRRLAALLDLLPDSPDDRKETDD